MCTQSGALKILSDVFDSCNSIFGETLKEAFLYGSYARGDFHQASDIDILLLVDMEPSDISGFRNAVAELTSNLSLEHDITVSVTVKSFEQFMRFKSITPFYKNVVAEGIRYAG